MSTAILGAFTAFHVAISLIAIMSGFVVVFNLLGSKSSKGWTATFLWLTLATSVTGFLFPFHGFTPALGTGIVALIVIGPTFLRHLRQETRRFLASDLRVRRGDFALPEFLCPDRAVVPEDSRAQCPGADAEGAALRDRAGLGLSSFHRLGHRGDHQVQTGCGYQPPEPDDRPRLLPAGLRTCRSRNWASAGVEFGLNIGRQDLGLVGVFTLRGGLRFGLIQLILKSGGRGLGVGGLLLKARHGGIELGLNPSGRNL